MRVQLSIGTLINARFRITEVIGSGGMAHIYAAQDRLHGDRAAAVKVMLPGRERLAEWRERFEREARVIDHAFHPHVLPVWEAGVYQGTFYIATPRADNDLASLIETRGALPAATALTLLRQVAWALDFAHGRGVVHRDVKPQNILLMDDLGGGHHAWLADFGIARMDDDSTLTGDFAPHTASYASPEQIRGDGRIDGRADQYSLACALYAALTGSPPFVGVVQDVRDAQIEAPPPPLSGRIEGLPAGLDAAAGRALAKDRDERYPTCVELIDACVAALGDAPTVAAPAAPLPAGVKRFPGSGRRFGLPHQAAFFTGREWELDALERAFAVGDRAVVTQAIAGLGGVGKTQLAIRYMHEHLDEYDVVAWIRAEDGGNADLAGLARALGVDRDGMPAAEAAKRALAWLSDCEARWLLVLDNVASPRRLAELLPSYGNGRVLVTSRHRDLAQFGQVVALDVFDDDSAEEFLIARAGRPDDRSGARRLADALGGLPLALAHAAAYCAEGVSFDDYLELIDGLPARELFESSRDVFYERTVASTWQASIASAGEHAALAPRILAVAAWLAPDLIPSRVFECLLDDPSDVRQRHALRDGIGALHRLSLADATPLGINVHRLMQKVVRDDAVERADPTAAEAALAALDSAFPTVADSRESWGACEALAPHLAALTCAAGDLVDPRALVELTWRVCRDLVDGGDAPRALEIAVEAAAVAERRLGPDHEATLTAHVAIADVHLGAGRALEAIPILATVFGVRSRLHRDEDPMTSAVAHRLVFAQSMVGQATDLRSALADVRRLGDNLGASPAHAPFADGSQPAGRNQEAVTLLKAAITDRERLLGRNHPRTLQSRQQLATVYVSAGRIADGIAMLEAVVADSERRPGSEHPDTLAARRSLASAYERADRRAQAIELLEAVLADCDRLLGPDHLDTRGTRETLASHYWRAGRRADAVALQEAEFNRSLRLHGPLDPRTLKARADLAESYSATERTTEAFQHFEAVLEDVEKRLGPDDPLTLNARRALLDRYRQAGRTTAAIVLANDLLLDSERALGRDHADTLAAADDLASLYIQAERDREAIALLERMLAYRSWRFGADHPRTLDARGRLASCYWRAGRTVEATKLFGRPVPDHGRRLGRIIRRRS